VVGFNALGEGLRRLIEKSGLSTAFLLRKRMVLVFVGLSLATVFIVNNTGAAPWFAKVAGAFNGDRAFEHVRALARMEGRGVRQAGGAEAAAYVAEKFESYGLIPGGKGGRYLHSLQVQLVEPLEQPLLTLIGPDGAPGQPFQHQIDFGFVIEGHGGGGTVEAPLTFVGFSRDAKRYDLESFRGLDLRDRVVLLLQGNAPDDFATEALIRGARGVLWIVGDERDPVRSQIQLAHPDRAYLRAPVLPIFRIRPRVAGALLEPDGLALSDLLTGDPGSADQTGAGWFARDLAAAVRMSVSLGEPQRVEIPCALGYKQGSDYNLASEVVVLAANYDGLGAEPDGTVFPAANHNGSGLGMLLEVAQLWQEQNLDARRSVLFVAWGGAQLDDPGVVDYLTTGYNYRHLSQLRTANPLEAAVVVQPDRVGAGSDTLFIHPDSDAKLAGLLEEAAAELSIAVTSDLVRAPARVEAVRLPEAEWLYFAWADAGVRLDQDTLERIDPAKFQSLGEAFALALTKIVRETEY
jgi:hypothetical protein